MKRPKISILMPVVKTRYFKDAFESAINQKFDDYEIIVVNNKADSDIGWVVDNARVKYFSHEAQMPPCQNWNFALKKATGDYVLYLSDDDVLLEDCSKNIAEFIANHQNAYAIRILRSDIDGAGRITGSSCPGIEWEEREQYLYYQYKYRRTQVLTDIVLQRENFLLKGGFCEELDFAMGWGADHLALIVCAEKGVFHLNKICVLYRLHNSNLSGNSAIAKAKILANIFWTDRILALIDEKSSWASQAILALNKYKKDGNKDAYLGIVRQCGLIEALKFYNKDTSVAREKLFFLCYGVVGACFLYFRKTISNATSF